jgi:hypothetical protein
VSVDVQASGRFFVRIFSTDLGEDLRSNLSLLIV